MQSADSAEISPRPRFPALDPEPPPPPGGRLGATLIVLVAGLGGWLGYSLSGTAPHHSAAVSVSFLRGLAGVVLAETPGSYLSETDMQTGKVVVFKNLGQFSSNPDPAVSADGKYLLDVAVAQLLSVSRVGYLETVPNALNALSFSPGDMPGFAANPWSDHDTRVVELSYPIAVQGLQSDIPVAVVESLRTGSAVSLGPADSAAGDPQQAGAFIAVPSPGQPFSNGNQPDASLVLTDVGARSRLLATAGQLSHVLGIRQGTAVSLVPVPNPQGSMVAVQVSAMNGSAFGVVVVSRRGALLWSQPGAGSFLAWAGWSHSSKTLAVVGYSGARPELIEWTVGVRSVTTPLHDSSLPGPTACAWSPDDTAVICDGGPRGNWLVIRSGTESVTVGQGQPLVWTNGRLRG
jgi:hypothetical protein